MDLLNPAGGGGLSKTKLAAATAKPSEVATGKTFYAGDKNLQTGTGPRSKSGTISFTKSNVTQTLDLGFVPSRGYIIRDGSYSNAHYLNSSGQLFGTNDDTEQVTLSGTVVSVYSCWGASIYTPEKFAYCFSE